MHIHIDTCSTPHLPSLIYFSSGSAAHPPTLFSNPIPYQFSHSSLCYHATLFQDPRHPSPKSLRFHLLGPLILGLYMGRSLTFSFYSNGSFSTRPSLSTWLVIAICPKPHSQHFSSPFSDENFLQTLFNILNCVVQYNLLILINVSLYTHTLGIR